jgi:integrase
LIAVSGCVFPSPRGKVWAIRNFHRNVWSPAQEKAGVACTLDDLRHTFASRLLAAGIPLIEVSAWMGHGLRAGGHEITNTTTRVYVHVTGESRQAALDELATLIAAPILDANRAQH